ncbi:MAG: hypothetical protein WDM85_00315 [Caulobacteraceae bacterium]
MPYDNSRGWFRGEADFPGPKTMTAATRWIDENAGGPEYKKDGRFFLFVDEFDPHEPFDTPERWAKKYDSDWEGPHLIWPPYAGRGHPARRPRRAPGPADPQPVRRQAVDDRPLAGQAAGYDRGQGAVGRHHGGDLHRPRPLPSARRTSGASRARRSISRWATSR